MIQQDINFPVGTYIQYTLLNVVSAFLCSAAHNTLYFMLGFSAWFFHFMHYFVTFVVLLLLTALKFSHRKAIPFRHILPISLSQFVVSTATGVIHSGGKDGAVYTLRVGDFGVTLLVMYITPFFLEDRYVTKKEYKLLIVRWHIGIL